MFMYCCWPCSWLVSSRHVYVLTSVTTLSWIHQACNSHFFFNFTSSPFMPQSALVGAGASTDPIKVVFCSIGMFYPSPSFYPPLPWPHLSIDRKILLPGSVGPSFSMEAVIHTESPHNQHRLLDHNYMLMLSYSLFHLSIKADRN